MDLDLIGLPATVTDERDNISKKSPLRIASSAILLVLLVILVVRVVFGASTSATMFNFPFQFDESEGMIVAETMLIDRG